MLVLVHRLRRDCLKIFSFNSLKCHLNVHYCRKVTVENLFYLLTVHMYDAGPTAKQVFRLRFAENLTPQQTQDVEPMIV